MKSVVARGRSENLVFRQSTSLLHPNPWENVTDNPGVYMDDVELEWLSEEDIYWSFIAVSTANSTTLVSGTPVAHGQRCANHGEAV